MNIRRFQSTDAIETAQVIARTLKISNSKDYSKEFIEASIENTSFPKHSIYSLLLRYK